MKKLFAVAVFVLASTAAQAQYSFEYGGRTIRIDPDKGTVSIPGVYDNTGKRTKRSRDQDTDRQRKPAAPDEAKIDPQPPAAVAPAPAAPAPAVVNAPPAQAPVQAPATANTGSDNTITSVQPADTSVPPVEQQPPPAVKQEAPPPVVATAPPPAPVPPPAPAPAPQIANSPIGVWLTEEREGKVRIEACGANLCGYSVNARTNQNGDQVLINMKPGKDKWSGRIFDPKSGSTYDSTIAMKGQDSLRVQGCALGGMFCGGQTWSRVN